MSWQIDETTTHNTFRKGDIVRSITEPHKDRILIVFRVSQHSIYLKTASGTYIPTFSKPLQDIRYITRHGPSTAYHIISAIEYPSDSSSSNSISSGDTTNSNTSSSSNSTDNTSSIVLGTECHPPNTLTFLQWKP